MVLTACGGQSELLLESRVTDAFAEEGITLSVTVRSDRSREQEPPVRDVLLPTSLVVLDVEGCRSEFSVSIFGTVDDALRAWRNAYSEGTNETTRVEANGVIGWRRKNVVIGVKKGSTCVSEERVSAAVDRLD